LQIVVENRGGQLWWRFWLW